MNQKCCYEKQAYNASSLILHIALFLAEPQGCCSPGVPRVGVANQQDVFALVHQRLQKLLLDERNVIRHARSFVLWGVDAWQLLAYD